MPTMNRGYLLIVGIFLLSDIRFKLPVPHQI